MRVLRSLFRTAKTWTVSGLIFASVLLALDAFSQCGQDIDLNTWIQEGDSANGNWMVSTTGDTVTQSINGDPTFYVSPDSFINVVIQGDIRVNTTNDNDWIGFVFGYESPDSSTNDYDFYIFSWKQEDQNFSGYLGSEGYTLARVDGAVTNLPEAFSGFTGPYVDVIGSQYSNTSGWNDQQTYSFELTYTNTRTVIVINGDTLFDVYGCYVPGRFGFYNYSQSDVSYSNFSYRVAAAFEVVTPNVCVGDTALVIALSDSCPSMPGAQVNNTIVGWDWDLGDGTTSTDTNASHVYSAPGTYLVRLIVTDYIGCKDTAYNTIEVFGSSAALGNDTSICSNESIDLNPEASGNTLTYLWQDASTDSMLTVTGPGTYHVAVTDTIGCTVRDTIVISDITAPSVNLGADTSICNNDTHILVATYPGATYLWQDASTNDSLALSSAGIYAVTVFEGVCSDTDSITIAQYANPSVSPPDPTLCYGETLTISASGASTYKWFPAAGLTDTVGDSVGTFTLVDTTYGVVGTDTNGCRDTSTFQVSVTPLPTASISGGDSVCIGDSVQLSIALTGTGPWDIVLKHGPSLTNLNGIASSPYTFYTSTAGLYTVISVTDSGCTNQGADSTIVVIHQLPTPSVSTTTNPICRGQSTVLTASGGSSYAWAASTSLSGTSGANVTASPTSNTQYTVEVTDSNGCVDSGTFTMYVYQLPNISVSAVDDRFCLNGSTSLTATGGSTYAWANVAGLNAYTGANVTATPLVTSSYDVYGTDGNGCTDTATIQIIVDTLPTIVINPASTAICLNDSASLSASGAQDYVWDPNTTISSTTAGIVSVTPTATITYSIIGTDANGCVGDTSVKVRIKPLPTVSLSPISPEICIGQSQMLIADGTPNTTSMEWDNTTTLNSAFGDTVIATPTVTTLYTVIGTDTNGCNVTDNVTLTVHPLPVLSATQSDDTLCIGEQTSLSVSGANVYNWKLTNGLNTYAGANVVATPTTTSTYEVVGTDLNGCKDSVQYPVVVNPLPVLSINPSTTAICIGNSTQLTASGASDYVWDPGSTLNTTMGATVTATPTVSTIYSITGTDSNGCVSTESATVTVNTLPVLTLSLSSDTICTGSQITLSAIGASNYIWSPSIGLTGFNTANPTGNPTQTTLYSVTGTDVNGCTSSESITVNVYPVPNYTAGADVDVCVGDSVQLQASGGVSYEWGPAFGLSQTDTSSPFAQGLSTRTYTVTITDIYDCEFTDEVWVNVHQLPFADGGPDYRACFKDSVQLGGAPTGPSTASFEWVPPQGLSSQVASNPYASPSVTTTYTLTVISDQGCRKSDFVTVTVDTIPDLEIIKKPSFICLGTAQQVQVTPGLSYLWSPDVGISDVTVSNPFFNPPTATTYTLVGTDSNGCSKTIEMELDVQPSPVISISGFADMCEGDTAQLSVSGADMFIWSDGESLSDSLTANPLAYPVTTTSYGVTGIDSNGCSNQDSTLLIVHSVPNIDAGEDIENCNMATIRLGGEPTGPVDATYTWSPAELLDDMHGPNPRVIDTERRMFYLHAISPYGCESEDSVYVNADCYDQIYAPAAFTPDDDGLQLNETFKISYWRVYNPHLKVFDKWGKLIFETRNLDNGWDGKYKLGNGGAPIGVYYWELTYETETGRDKSAKGTVSLLR